ncbi:HEAT repeat protein [Kineosphaera limosa]|uniref:HEAT repeat domain-containing protein n=1 Tax=Kineosphaera limosa TaxID=111564 RepID=UPI0002D43A12|nr:HEAT repeat domain-containing protein [Kineosphaera limosa]NYD99610.1 HEAT repeat protein [Kineosphaera limosa]
MQRSRTLERLAAPQRRLVLEVASGEDDDNVAADALAGLRKAEWESIRPAVIAMLAKVRGAPAEQLVRVIAAHGEVELARRRLTSGRSLHRARGAYLLGLVRAQDAVPELLELLRDPADEVRLVACRSLGFIADPAAAKAVLEAVVAPAGGDRVGVPSWVAAESLLAMGAGAQSALLAGLEHEDPRVREVAITVTNHSSLPATIEALRVRLGKETEPDLRIAMVGALGRLGDHADLPALLGAAEPNQSSGMRRAAVKALGDLGHRDAAEPLSALLPDPDRALAAAAAEALTHLGAVGIDTLHAARAQGREARRIAAAALHVARLRESAGG